MPLHRGIFTQRYFYAEIFLHGDAFTHTDTLLHTYTCTHTHTNSARKSSASRCKTRISPFDLGAFRAKGFCERKQHVNFTVFFFQPSNRNFTAVLTIETLKGYAKLHFRQFSRIETHFVGKGWPGSNPHSNFTSVFEDRHFVREGCVSWTSIHAALQPSEKIGFFFEVVGAFAKLIFTCTFASATLHLHKSTCRRFVLEVDPHLRIYIYIDR